MAKSDRQKDLFRRYFMLREAVESVSSQLFDKYRSDIKCSKGCSQCCDDISVLPIEWYFLQSWVKENRSFLDKVMRQRFYGENRCPFLHREDESCSIYPIRPIICRVHGLPIRYAVEEYDLTGQRVFRVPPEYSFAWCDFNFKTYDPEQATDLFPIDGFIDLETWNHSLKKMNSEFLSLVPKKKIPANCGWISLSTLVE